MTTQLHADAAPLVEGPPTLRIAQGIATITLRRPSQRNSLHDEDLHCLLAYFAQLNADLSVRVVVLTAHTGGQAKPVFSAGYFLGGFDLPGHDPQLFERIPDALEQMRPLTVCALKGSVYGGATDLVLACDLRLGCTGTEWRMPAAALGLHYYPSGLRRYVSRMGSNLAKRAFLTGQALPCALLHSGANLFVDLVAPEDFDGALQALTHHLASLAPLAVQATKQSLNELGAGVYEEAALRARELRTATSQDFAEGRAAFAARRPPQFTGQ